MTNELPANLEAERSILGALLLQGGSPFQRETEGLTPEHFYLDAHKRIWRAMLAVGEDGSPLESLTISNELQGKGELERVGGVSYLSSLIDAVPERPSIAHYVQILDDKLTRRQLYAEGERMMADALEGNCKIAVTLDRAQNKLFKLAGSEVGLNQQFMVPWSKFRKHGSGETQWLVGGVIEKGTNGFIIALPKGGKSVASLGLAVSLITGYHWLELKVYGRRRVGIISREDYAGMTSRRLEKLLIGQDVDPSAGWLEDYLYVNSRAETKHLMLTDVKILRALINDLKAKQIEFLILDVLNVLHDQDENDNSEMRSVLKRVEHIRDEVGCQICIVHHSRKNWEEGMTLSEIARGSSAIAGFAEWMVGFRLVDEENQIRQAKFETKSDFPEKSFYWRIANQPVTKSMQLERAEYTPPKKGKGSRVKDLIGAKP